MSLLSSLTVNIDSNIREAMQCMSTSGKGICFVVEGKKLVGVVSDGDLRRNLLLDNNLERSINGIVNKNCVTASVNESPKVIRNLFAKNLKLVPLVDQDGNLVDYADATGNHRIQVLQPFLGGNELEYVTDCIRSGWISSQGKYVSQFESMFEEMHPGTHAIATSSGTTALHLAMISLGIGPGDEVIIPNLTFAATINAALYCGATPVLCDISPHTLCIDCGELKKLINKKTRAIVPVHLYGQPCDMHEINDLLTGTNILVIEDCAEAIGSRIGNQLVGTYGDAAIFSFFGNKTITTGEGGILLSKDLKVAERARTLRDHGMLKQKRYWHEEVGFNYRLTNLQAAIGVAQLERFPSILRKKMQIAEDYRRILKDTPGIDAFPPMLEINLHSNWLFTVVLNDRINRDLIIENLLSKGIETRPVFYPLHLMPPYANFPRSSSTKNSERISKGGLSLPTSVQLTESDIAYIGSNLGDALLQQLGR